MQVSGNVQKIGTRQLDNGKIATNIMVNGQWYGCGFYGVKCSEGDVVQFDAVQRGNFVNCDTKTLRVIAAGGQQQPAQQQQGRQTSGGRTGFAGTATAGGKDNYWENKEKRDVVTQKVIQLQASRNSAIAVCSAALSAGILPLPAKKADAFDAYLAAVDEVTARYERDSIKKATGEAVFEEDVEAQPDDQQQTTGAYEFDDDIHF